MVEFRQATGADAEALAPRLRSADMAELQAAHGGADTLLVLRQALTLTPDARAAVAGGQVLALMGCRPAGTLMTPFGVPWLLGSDECARHARVFLAAGRPAVAGWLQRFGLLENWTDARHAQSHAWLRRLGFHMEQPAPYGAQGLPFIRFWLRCA